MVRFYSDGKPITFLITYTDLDIIFAKSYITELFRLVLSKYVTSKPSVLN